MTQIKEEDFLEDAARISQEETLNSRGKFKDVGVGIADFAVLEL